MKTVHVKTRYSGGGYIARAGQGKNAKTVSCTHSPSAAAQRAAAKFFGLDTSKAEAAIDVAGRFDHATGGTYVATLLDLPEKREGASVVASTNWIIEDIKANVVGNGEVYPASITRAILVNDLKAACVLLNSEVTIDEVVEAVTYVHCHVTGAVLKKWRAKLAKGGA